MKTKTKNVMSNTITSLPPSPDQERHRRMIRYSLAMLIRIICIMAAFFVPGWWRVLPFIGAIVLPYVAVVLANVGHEGERGVVQRPGGVEIYRPEQPYASTTFGSYAPPAPGSPAEPHAPFAAPASGSNGEPRPDQR